MNEEIAAVERLLASEQYDEALSWACAHHDAVQDPAVIAEVIKCYQICVAQKLPLAALNLGTFYYNGVFIQQDFQKAFELYKIAAEAGICRAICDIGYCYYYGRQGPANYQKAQAWFTKGAILFQDANCLYKLGDLYLNGKAGEKNEKYAYLLFCHAEEACGPEDDCLPDIQLRLGSCLLHGSGTAKDTVAAFDLLSAAYSGFYRRQTRDPFAAGLLNKTESLLEEAKAVLRKAEI